MYIRIEFKDVDSEATKNVRHLFLGIPNGTCLSSSQSYFIWGNETVMFWKLDVQVLNKYHGGSVTCLHQLQTYAGVKRVDILPIEGDRGRAELIELVMQYVDEPFFPYI